MKIGSLSSNYYTLKNNIDNKGSSVFISTSPTLEQIQKVSIELPSHFYVLSKKQGVVCMILFLNSPKPKFVVVYPVTGEQKEFDCKIKGDISENRAKEIVENKYDTKTIINDNLLIFNNNKLKIYKSSDLTEAILDLVKSEKLNKVEVSNLKTLTQNEIKMFMLQESKEGGKLDFFTPIKGKEYDGFQIKPGIISTNLEIALYNWGRAAYELGVNSIEDTYNIFAEYKLRTLNQREKEFLKMGFEKSIRKMRIYFDY